MKLSLSEGERQSLEKVLPVLMKVVEAKTSMPILQSLLFKVAGHSLHITASDLETFVTAEVPISTGVPGACCIPAKEFVQTVERLPAGTLDITVDDKSASIAAGRPKVKLPIQKADLFPALPKAEDLKEVGVLAGDLFAEQLKRVITAVSTDVTGRAMLCGVCLSAFNDRGALVATDGHILSVTSTKLRNQFKDSLIVPTEAAKALLALGLKAGTDEVTIRQGQSTLGVSCNGLEIVARLISGEYPDFINAIPKDEEPTLFMQRQDLLDALALAEVTSDSSKQIILEVAAGRFFISSKNATSNSVFPVELTSEPPRGEKSVCVNGAMLRTVVSAIGEDEIELAFKDRQTPIVIHPTGLRDERLHLVMPMRES